MQFINKIEKKWYEFWKNDLSVTLYGMNIPDNEFVGHLKTYTDNFPKNKRNFSMELVLENNAHVTIGPESEKFLEDRFSGFSFVFVSYKNSIM